MNNSIEISFFLTLLSAVLAHVSAQNKKRFFVYTALLVTFFAAILQMPSLQGLQFSQPFTGLYNEMINIIRSDSCSIMLGFKYDVISIIGVFCVSTLCFLSCLYSLKYLKSCATFIACSNCFAASMMLLIASNDLIQMYVGLELITLFSYLLINYYYESNSSVKNIAFKIFALQKFGDMFFLLASMIIFYHCDSFDISKISNFSIFGFNGHDVIISMILITIAIKSSQFGFTWWLQDAMIAPTPASAFLHAATLVASGMFILCRLLAALTVSKYIIYTAISYFLISSIYCAFSALKEYDLKKILAYSTSSKMGMLLTACIVGNVEQAVIYFAIHAFAKFTLFICVGNISYSLSHEQDIRNMGGLIVNLPKTYILTLLTALMFIGAIPNVVSHAAFHSSNMIVNTCVYCTTLLTMTYMVRIISHVFHGKHNVHERSSAYISEDRGLTYVLSLCVILNLFFRCFAFNSLSSNVLDTPLEYIIDILLFVICFAAYKYVNLERIKYSPVFTKGINWCLYIDDLKEYFEKIQTILENRIYRNVYYILARSNSIFVNVRSETYCFVIGSAFVVILLLDLMGVL